MKKIAAIVLSVLLCGSIQCFSASALYDAEVPEKAIDSSSNAQAEQNKEPENAESRMISYEVEWA